MLKLTVQEIEEVIKGLASALSRAKEARRVASKVYGDQKEVSLQLKYVHEDVAAVKRKLELDE